MAHRAPESGVGGQALFFSPFQERRPIRHLGPRRRTVRGPIGRTRWASGEWPEEIKVGWEEGSNKRGEKRELSFQKGAESTKYLLNRLVCPEAVFKFPKFRSFPYHLHLWASFSYDLQGYFLHVFTPTNSAFILFFHENNIYSNSEFVSLKFSV